MAREAIGIVGGAVGFAIGGPVGANIGFTIGSMVGGALFPEKIPGPSLGAAPIQTSRDGIPIPVGWGIFHVSGNVIQKSGITEVTTSESQGKGGGAEVEVTKRYQTFAIGVCRGPIYSIRRIWENNRLVYDARAAGVLVAADQAAYADKITIYTGSETQTPDAELEAVTGVGNTPSYRGMCYVVWNNYEITPHGSMIPQYRFEVLSGADLTVTSRPYPLEVIEGYAPAVSFQRSELWAPPIEGYDATVTPQEATLRVALKSHTLEVEGYDATVTPQEATLRVALHSYTPPPEGYDATVTPQEAILRVALISHNYEVEGYDATVTPLSAILSTP